MVDAGDHDAVTDAEGVDPVAELELDHPQDRVQVDGPREVHGKRLTGFVVDDHPLHLTGRKTDLEVVGRAGNRRRWRTGRTRIGHHGAEATLGGLRAERHLLHDAGSTRVVVAGDQQPALAEIHGHRGRMLLPTLRSRRLSHGSALPWPMSGRVRSRLPYEPETEVGQCEWS